MMMAVAEVGAVHPVDDPVEGKAEHDEDDAQDALTPHPAFLGDAPIPPHYLALGSWSPGSQPRTLGQADLQRRLRMMLQDQEQLAQGRDISTVTMTDSIVTSYKQGGAPSVQTSSSRVSP